jgi:3-methyladenine DNA glycosylase AlkC
MFAAPSSPREIAPSTIVDSRSPAVADAPPGTARPPAPPPAHAASPSPARKGARRISEIPPEIRRRLDEGLEETRTLVEWLAIDATRLLGRALADVGLDEARRRSALEAAERAAGDGVTRRTKAIGGALHRALAAHPRRTALFEGLAGHRADTVRSWAAYSVAADSDLPLEERLAIARRFAADSHMAVRECAWDSFRPFVAADLAAGLRLLGPWVRDRDPNVRRCAIEATRPRGVWTEHVAALKLDPGPGLALLEPCRSDPSDYVRRSVANWLNDASKSRPEWVRRVCARWRRESRTRETAWIVRRALRTIDREATPARSLTRARPRRRPPAPRSRAASPKKAKARP